jgi:hypothetical protein
MSELQMKRRNLSLRGLIAGKYVVLAFEELQEDVRASEFLKLMEVAERWFNLRNEARNRYCSKSFGAKTQRHNGVRH